MKTARTIAVLFFLLPAVASLVACSSVTTQEPLPMREGAEHQERLSGVWTAEGEVLVIRFTGGGVGRVAALEWKDEDFHLERAEVTLSGGEALNLMSVRVQEEGDWADEYFFVSYDFGEKGELVVRMPKTDFFDEAIAAGRLRGEVDASEFGKDIRVTASPEDFLAFLLAQDPAAAFDDGEPLVLGRVDLAGR